MSQQTIIVIHDHRAARRPAVVVRRAPPECYIPRLDGADGNGNRHIAPLRAETGHQKSWRETCYG
jgi:hypothetical protein